MNLKKLKTNKRVHRGRMWGGKHGDSFKEFNNGTNNQKPKRRK